MTPKILRDWASNFSQLAAAGEPCFVLLDFELLRPRLWRVADLDGDGIQFSFPGLIDDRVAMRHRPIALQVSPPDYDHYHSAFGTVQRGLQRGDSFLTNLTFRVPVELGADLTTVYRSSQAKYRVLLPGEFCCFSPETFVTISNEGYIESRPMKGTAIDTPTARAALLTDKKEIAEHATIVDLIRNDLSRVARGVKVTEYRYLRAIEHLPGGLVQTSSRVGGQLPEDWRNNLGNLLLKLLPAGSVSGAPKAATLALIRAAEDGPRGYYCGIAGYFDGRAFDSCVLIRYLEQDGGGYGFRSGGGITALSEVRAEYAELLAKVRIPVATTIHGI